MDLISHGRVGSVLIDHGPLPFLDPVSCVVTELQNSTHLEKSFTFTPTARDWSLANFLSFTFFVFYLIIHFTYFRPPLSVSVWTGVNFERV